MKRCTLTPVQRMKINLVGGVQPTTKNTRCDDPLATSGNALKDTRDDPRAASEEPRLPSGLRLTQLRQIFALCLAARENPTTVTWKSADRLFQASTKHMESRCGAVLPTFTTSRRRCAGNYDSRNLCANLAQDQWTKNLSQTFPSSLLPSGYEVQCGRCSKRTGENGTMVTLSKSHMAICALFARTGQRKAQEKQAVSDQFLLRASPNASQETELTDGWYWIVTAMCAGTLLSMANSQHHCSETLSRRTASRHTDGWSRP